MSYVAGMSVRITVCYVRATATMGKEQLDPRCGTGFRRSR